MFLRVSRSHPLLPLANNSIPTKCTLNLVNGLLQEDRKTIKLETGRREKQERPSVSHKSSHALCGFLYREVVQPHLHISVTLKSKQKSEYFHENSFSFLFVIPNQNWVIFSTRARNFNFYSIIIVFLDDKKKKLPQTKNDHKKFTFVTRSFPSVNVPT